MSTSEFEHNPFDDNMKALFADAAPAKDFEDEIIARLRTASRGRLPRLPLPSIKLHPAVRHTAAAIAASIVVAAVGYVASESLNKPARYVQSASNLRSLGQGVSLYANDDRGEYRRPAASPAAESPGDLAKAMNGELLQSFQQNQSQANGPQWDFGGGANAALSWSGGWNGRKDLSDSRQNSDADANGTFNRPFMNTLHGDVTKAGQAPAQLGIAGREIDVTRRADDAAVSLGRKVEIVGGAIAQEGARKEKQVDAKEKNPVVGKAAEDLMVSGNAAPNSAMSVTGDRFKPNELSLGQQLEQGQRGQGEDAGKKLQDQVVSDQNKSAGKERAPQQAPPANRPPEKIAQTDPAPSTSPMQRKIIRNGSLEFEVDSFDASVSRLTSIVLEEGGFIGTTNSDKLPNGKVKGIVVARVAPDRLDALVLKLRALGDLKSQNLTAQDVTKQFTDLESELRAGRAMEERLLEMIKNGKGEIKDLLAAEKELANWRTKIEKVTGEINYYSNLISLSTLEITLVEKDIRTAAAVSENETVDMGVETEDVEKARADAIKAVDEVQGRIVESQLKQFDAGQLAAKVVAEVALDKAGGVIDRFKQLGKIARLDVQRQTTTPNGQPPAPGSRVERKDTRIVVSFYNLANVAPRVTTSVNLASDDVEKAYHAIVERVAAANGRVISANINRQQSQSGVASVQFEVKSADAEAVATDVRGAGEVMKLESTQNADTNNVTSTKRGFVVLIVSTSSAAPRQVTTKAIAAGDVSASYETLLAAARKVNARVVVSTLEQQSGQPTTGWLDFEIRRDQQGAIEAALNGAGDAVSGNVTVSSDTTNTLESKLQYKLSLTAADQQPPREATMLAVETRDVETAATQVAKIANEAGGRMLDSNISKEAGGRTTARLSLDIPLSRAVEVIDRARSTGTVRVSQSSKNAQVPAGKLARARVDVILGSPDAIMQADSGVWSTIRNGLATSAAGLMWSLRLIVIGLCLVAPWALMIWGGWKLSRRAIKRRAAGASAST